MDRLPLLLLLALQSTTTMLEHIQKDSDWPTPPAPDSRVPSDKTAVDLGPFMKNYLQEEGKDRCVHQKLYSNVS